MRVIHKHVLSPVTRLSLPVGAEILCVHEQYGEPCMWTLGDLNLNVEVREFILFGTGFMISDKLNYIGTAHLHGGQLVMHCFEKLI